MCKKKNKGVGSQKAWAVEMRKRPCAYCGHSPAGTVDHVVPVSEGGRTVEENCVPACEPCNQERARIGRNCERAHMAESQVRGWTLAEKYGVAFGV
jgi:5-methylcytosine-specific restriction endonuclease McrA